MSGEPEALATVPAAPAARGPGSALRALAFYAANGEAPPRDGQADRTVWGAGQVLASVRLLFADRRLLSAAIPPTLLTVLGCGLLAALVSRATGDASWFEASFATFLALASMPPTVLQPLWWKLGLQARLSLGAVPGELERPGERWLRALWREGWKALRQAAVVAVGLVPVYLLVAVLPLLGHWITVALGVLWAFYWIVVDAFEIPIELQPGKLGEGEAPWFERLLGAAGARSRWLFLLRWGGRLSGRLARPWRHECAFTERQPGVALGFGLAVAALLAVPVLNVFFRAVAITAATAVLVRAEER